MRKTFVLIWLLTIISCSSQQHADQPPALITVPGASNVKFATIGGSRQLSYTLDAPYPAPHVIERISSELKNQGWTPLKEDWLNPGLESSHVDGWDSFGDATTNPRTRVFQWLAPWKDNDGNIVSYALQYRDPDNGPTAQPRTSSLQVSSAYFPRKVAEAMIERAKLGPDNRDK